MTPAPLSDMIAILPRLLGEHALEGVARRPLAAQKTMPASHMRSISSSMPGGMVPSSASSVQSISVATTLMDARSGSLVYEGSMGAFHRAGRSAPFAN